MLKKFFSKLILPLANLFSFHFVLVTNSHLLIVQLLNIHPYTGASLELFNISLLPVLISLSLSINSHNPFKLPHRIIGELANRYSRTFMGLFLSIYLSHQYFISGCMASSMQIMPPALMIDIVLLDFVSCLDEICCPGVQENNQLWQGATWKLNIELLLLPPLIFCGFSLYSQSFKFHLPLHLYSVAITIAFNLAFHSRTKHIDYQSTTITFLFCKAFIWVSFWCRACWCMGKTYGTKFIWDQSYKTICNSNSIFIV